MNLFRRKKFSSLINETKSSQGLSKVLTVYDLILLGVGSMIGTGIFIVTGTASLNAGPAVTISFIIAALACVFSALSYAEFSSTVPVSGAVYTYSYLTLGEIVAWLIGWDLVLEYLLGASSVAVGWSGYFQAFLSGFNIHLPESLTAAPGVTAEAMFNLPAFVILFLITALLSSGIKSSKTANNVMVVIKVSAILLFLLVGFWYVKPENLTPFAPFGFNGVLAAASMVFYAFIGFDAIASAAEETKNPAKDLPKGILISLGICALLYVLVSFVMTGTVPYYEFSKAIDHPITLSVLQTGHVWLSYVVNLAAVFGMITVILVLLYGQTRISYSMARDGLLPKIFSKVHKKYKTPFGATWFVGLVAGLIGGLVPLDKLAELVNIGTLFAFSLVCLGVLVIRYKMPEIKTKFKCPLMPVIPILGILLNSYLIYFLKPATWYFFFIWMLIGLIIYFTYSSKNSNLNKK